MLFLSFSSILKDLKDACTFSSHEKNIFFTILDAKTTIVKFSFFYYYKTWL